jgi:hypothetical protein
MSIENANPSDENALAEPLSPEAMEDAAAAAFAAKFEADEAKQPEAADKPETDAEPEADEADPEEAEETDELVEQEFEGKTYKVAPEVAKAMLRQADYSRNMNAVTAEKKAAAAQLEKAEKLIEGAEKYAEVKATVNQLDAQIKHFEKLDWVSLRRDNPAEYAALAADLQTVRISRQEAVQKATAVDAEISETKQKLMADARAEMDAVLRKDLKGWGDELGASLTKFALDKGVRLETLQALTDPGMVKVLDDAAKYAALQKGKAEIKAKAQGAPPVLKPGAKRVAPTERTEAMDRLRKTNSSEDAELAFLSRMK